ncbi:MAG: hypothetical protein JXR36_13480 [Bacteroidales bacterium]|nr:hypothetical protein [Bacteroidales bacterium]
MEMTVEQALQILDQAASRAMLPRQEHYQVQIAVETLKNLISSTNQKKEDNDNPN